MGINWNRFTHLATDGNNQIWVYRTNHVARDIRRMDVELPTYPTHELIPAESQSGLAGGISVIFHGGDIMTKIVEPMRNLYATYDRISDRIVNEGIGDPVAKQGKPHDSEER